MTPPCQEGSLALRCAAAVAAAALALSCTEDPLALGADEAPGASTETRDITLSASDLPSWRDTSLTGFATPSTAAFTLVAEESGFSARTLALFDVPDTVRTFADTLPAERYDSVTFRLQIDTVRSELPELPVTFRIVSLTQPFDADEVTWEEAAPGTPWGSPGGSLGVVLASAQLSALADTLPMDLAVAGDSLLKAWRSEDGGDGVAVLVEGGGARVRVQQVLLRYDVLLEGRTAFIEQSQVPDPRTFITDPPLPDAGLPLRVGGLPASRFYLEFVPPGSVDGIPLVGSTVNHAELILRPLAPPPQPFALETTLEVRQVSLLGDPFTLGEKTPIGSSDAGLTALSPDTLATGRPLRLDVTSLLARAAADSLGAIRIGLRADPDAQTFGFWEFGSIESMPAMRPRLRLILSPPPDFGVP